MLLGLSLPIMGSAMQRDFLESLNLQLEMCLQVSQALGPFSANAVCSSALVLQRRRYKRFFVYLAVGYLLIIKGAIFSLGARAYHDSLLLWLTFFAALSLRCRASDSGDSVEEESFEVEDDNLQDTLLWASSQGEYSDSPWQSTRPPEASTWSDEASVTDLAELLTRLERAEDQLWSNVEKDDELVADLLKIPLRSFMTSQRQADAIERVLNGLKRKIAMFKWQYRELLELISSTAVGNAGVVRERLGKLRMRLSDTLRNVSLIALEEFGVFASRLKSKPKERVLVAREYGAEMALSMHRVETMAKKYKLLCDARTKVLERMQNWDKELTSQSVRMSERAMEEIRIQMDSYASAAGSAMSVKEAEFTRFVKTSRMEELYFQSIIEDCIHQLNTKGVAVIDVSKAWDPTNPGVLTAVGRISKIIEAISALNDSWSIYPAFVHVDEQDTKYPGGSSRLQLQPSVRTIQAAVEPLFQEPGLSQYCVISISQLLTRSVVASANVAGMAVSPISVFVSTEPAVVSSAKHFGFHFTRRLAHLGASDFSITSENQKVLIAYLGQTPYGRVKRHFSCCELHCLELVGKLGSAIVSFLSYDASGPYELLKLRSHVKSELAYVAAIERNTNTRLLSEALTDGYGALLADGVSDLGYVKLFERHNTAVFVGITRLPPLQLPLSSFLRAAAFIMRIEVARSKYGQREYVVPSRDTVLQALTHLFLYPVIGDAQALVRTKLWSDTRFPLLRVKFVLLENSVDSGFQGSPCLRKAKALTRALSEPLSAIKS
ncbi:hypothetical protein cyc_03097 [Cyclospora cayetanensis]|uniref:Uncharacterized protein n=1 Tax=Cyclospora cayetanensis TaxID=88456 RepID=A0A1D3D490_9EIME|nr:hypothetical protein cyc_03097 [Cyclospora cayetanensis]